MSIPPPANTTAIRATQQVATNSMKLRGNPWMLGLAVVAGGMSWWMLTDRYESNKPREEQEAAMYRVNQDMQYAHIDQNIRGGQNKMAELAKSWIGLNIYGPFGVNESWEETKRKIHSVIKEVLIPCTIPLGVAIASTYAYFGPQAINSKLGYAGRKIGGVFLKGGMLVNLQKYAGKAFNGTVDGTAKMLTHAVKNPAITLGMLLLGAWFLKCFTDVKSGEDQHDYFKTEILTPEENYQE